MMEIIAWILFAFRTLYYVMVFIGPLAKVTNRKKPELGGPVLLSWLKYIAFSFMFSYLLMLTGMKYTLLDMSILNFITVASWVLLAAGLTVVIWSFVKKSRLRKQQRVTVTN